MRYKDTGEEIVGVFGTTHVFMGNPEVNLQDKIMAKVFISWIWQGCPILRVW